jgi:hypothetical protein
VWVTFGAGSIELVEMTVSKKTQKQKEITHDTVGPETCGCASGEPVQAYRFQDERHWWIYFGPRKEFLADPEHRSVFFVRGVCRVMSTMRAEPRN